MIVLSKEAHGEVLEILPEKAILGMLRKGGGVIDPALVEEEWFTEEDLEALGLGVRVIPWQPLPGEVVFTPTRTGRWAKVRVR